jgi:putative endonuclease
MLTDRQRTGLLGERVASRWLRARGWTIVAERFRVGHRDIDLIAARKDPMTGGRLVAFVEVRTRRSALWGAPIETIKIAKQRQVAQAARAWIMSNGRPRDIYRFDVLGIRFDGVRTIVHHVPDAFWRRSFG